jgi:hypothetical protein
VEAIKAALRGEAPLSRAMTACLVDEFRSLGPPAAILEYLPSNRRLTRREWEVLSCIAEGYTNRRVAAQLSISMETENARLEHPLPSWRRPTVGRRKVPPAGARPSRRPALRVTISPANRTFVRFKVSG